jgi:hypothetical protein
MKKPISLPNSRKGKRGEGIKGKEREGKTENAKSGKQGEKGGVLVGKERKC